jgi:hypothetical protein
MPWSVFDYGPEVVVPEVLEKLSPDEAEAFKT